ncbi:WD40 repeat-like protein [Aulographum hederae CBS 113979]|uniref:WD40 repeat-like protein n=1 Tax=Aulographum hederae CBS 113979 TaxID=1176131 RepID=A0A6G1HD28_9PEZI|nr:WD40 repeat-like protein [Aulographum hederae CBS 113979]
MDTPKTSIMDRLASSAALPSTPYIYNLVPLSHQTSPTNFKPLSSSTPLATISSDNSLRLYDPSTLKILPDGELKNVHESVTCLGRFAPENEDVNVLVTAGRDAAVRSWDRRNGKLAAEMRSPKNQPFSALACDAKTNTIAAGTELLKDPPGDVSVLTFDVRNPSTPLTEYVDSHNDTITNLHFYPTASASSSSSSVGGKYLLSGSTDGLLNLFNLNIKEEEDAVEKVIDHRSAVHQCGWMVEDATKGWGVVWVMGTDETMSFHSVRVGEEDEGGELRLGDVRERFGGNYMVGVRFAAGKAVMGIGSHTEGYLDLLPQNPSLSDIWENPEGGLASYEFDPSERMRLENAHAGEVVRDFYIDDQGDVSSTTLFS